MADFYKKGVFGKLVKTEETDSKAIEVRLSIEEYRSLKKTIVYKEKEFLEEKKKNEEHYKKTKEQALELKDIRKELTDTKKKAEEREEELIEEIKKANLLNKGYKRIAIERANAKRGIKPKKEHDGYLVLQSRTWKEKIDGSICTGWKTRIQTPYVSSLPITQVKNEMGVELKDLLKELKIDRGVREIEYEDFAADENLLYSRTFVANYQLGFWELEICTTKGVEVPEHRRPREA